MKKLLIVVLFAVLVMGIDAQSTNRTWDKFFNEGSTNPAILYDGYTPNFNNYNEINMQSAIDIVTSYEKDKKNFDGYYLSKNLIVEEINNRSLRLSASGRWITHNNNLPPELEKENYVTVWYRGITRAGKNSRFVIDKIEITGNYVSKPTAEDIAKANQAKIEAERQKPRYSPEGKEYVKKTLIQVAGEVDKSANRGKTLFFETSHVEMKEGVTTGQWLVNDLNTKGITVMYYYGEKPYTLIYPTILYRVEISQSGFAKYTIDSFRETVANIWEVLSDSK
jgi:hypothetical protein